MKKKVLIYSAYFLAFAVALSFFLLNGLDSGSLAEKLEASVKENTGFDLDMRSLKLSLPFSAEMEGVELSQAGTRIKLDSVELRPVYWRLLLLDPVLRVTIKSGEGTARADISPGFFPRGIKLSLSAEKFPVGRVLVQAGGTPLPIDGELDVKASLSAPARSAADGNLYADLSLERITVNTDSRIGQAMSGVTPKTLKCAFEVKERLFATKECRAVTSVGSVELRVTSRLSENIAGSLLEGALVVYPEQKASGLLQTLYPKLLKPDGAYYFPLSGTPSNPHLGL